jgi:hypothetical protein
MIKKLLVTALFAGLISLIPSSPLPLFSSSLSAQIPSNGLVAWYPFNGNANDESGNGNHGVVNGATLTTDRFGNLNSSFLFEFGNFIDCGQLTMLGDNPSSFTISVWQKVGNISLSDTYVVGSKRHIENGATDWVTAGIYNGKYWMRFDDSGYMESNDLFSTTSADSSSWAHVVYVKNGPELRIYVNGTLEGTALDNHILEGSTFNYYLGGQLAWNKFFNGKLDDIGIYNISLGDVQIQQLYQDQSGQVQQPLTCNITTPTTTLCAGQSATLTMNTAGGAGASSQLPANLQQGLVAYYPFNGNANDESGNGFNGTVAGNLPYVTDRNGNANGAILFTAANCNTQVEAFIDNSQIMGQVTLSFWVNKQDSVCEGARFFASYFSQVGILNNTNGHFQFMDNTTGFSAIHVVGTGAVAASDYTSILGQWTMMSYVNDGESGYFYKNGELISQVQNNSNEIITLGDKIIFGHLGNSWAPGVTAFNGWMDDAAIWGRALSPLEIQQLYIAQSYAWSTNEATPTITVFPTQNSTYSCTVTQGNQTCTASVDITVNPAITNAFSATIVEGQSYTLGSQTLTTAGTYTEVFTSAAGCDSTVTLTLSVEPLLTCEITSNSTSVCSGEELILSMNSNAADIVNVGQSTFNGQGYIQFPNAGLTGSSSRTISYRAKTSSQNIMSVLNYGGAPNNGPGLVELGMNLNMWFGAGSGYCDSITKGVSFFSNSHSVNIGKTIFDNEWHTVTYVMGENNNSSFSSIKVYVDGILVSQGQNNTPFCGHNWGGWTYNTVDGPVTIGKPSSFNPYAAKFVGSIADVGMWSRALTSVEVANLNGQTPATIPLGLAHHYSLLGNAPVDLITGASGQVLGLTGSNIAWSTNETTPTITVSPTANTTYTCTITQGNQTCTASVDITVNPQQTFFADADGDGYGNPDVVVQDCNVPVGYVSDNTDCNDNNAAVFSASTETCNGLDDDCDGQVDEGLTIASVNATSVTTALYPTCSGNALKSANLNNGTNSDLIEGNGLDLWYCLTAQYNTLRASLSAAFGDNEIRLYGYNNGCFELLETEHEVYSASTLATGNQVLISDNLIPGQTYYIAVHNISGPINASAKMCFNHFVGTTCDHYYSNYTGIYNNVCTSFKAQYKGNATNYIFDVLSATQNNANLNITPWSYTTTTANSVVPRLGTIFPANMSASAKVYTLRIPVIYAIPDAAGNYTSITANATTTCTVTLNAELPVALRAVDRCPNTKSTTSSISIDRNICGALRYEWEFTQQLPSVQPAVTVLGGLNTTVFFLNNVPGMGTGKTYNVRVRPIHTNGEVGSWGTVQCLKTGTAGMVLENHPGSAGAGEWANSGTEQWANGGTEQWANNGTEAWANNGTEAWANNYSPEQEVRFTLYPNPTTAGRFILTASNTSDEEVKDIKMKDITGKVVFQTQVVLNGNAVEIEFGNLASGVYVVMLGEERLRLVVE